MPQFLIVTLRIVHILTGSLWVGGVFIAAVFLMPSMAAAGPAGGVVMKEIVGVRRYPLFMMSFMIITVLSGLGLMWWSSAGFSAQWMASPFGRTLSVGAAFTIIGAVFGVVVSKPSAERLQKIGAEVQASGGPPSAAQAAEMQMLQRKMLSATRVVAALLLLAAAAMASARYM